MNRIKPEAWAPADKMILEENALRVATQSQNSLIVAGPGAGKTELLAQKACFLLQTNTCKYPYKILAISFKRDAAYNLKERVKLRCANELSRRFDSLTFDSFAKQLLDRFKQALPVAYRITSEYDITLDDNFILSLYEAEDINLFHTTDRRVILQIHTAQLPHAENSKLEQVRKKVWMKMLNSVPSKLSFKMIMRLSEYIINTNPKIKQYLQETYQYVFLDEFQDTTVFQYDLFKSCFLGSQSFYTAVGDDKQRIMLWAGAHNSVFEDFIKDVEANRIPLKMNFRCAPRLVTVLNHLTEHLLGKTDFAIPSPKWLEHEGECSVWTFKNPDDEKKVLFDEVQNWIGTEQLNPRDICILVKQQLETYAGDLINYFNQNGIKARDENKFQDILSQDLSLFIISVLYTAFNKRAGENRQAAFVFLSNLHTEMEDYQLLKLEGVFNGFLKSIKKKYGAATLTENNIQTLIMEIVDFAGRDRIKANFPAYKNAHVLKSAITDLQIELLKSYDLDKDIITALDRLTGKNTIPVMTIHKSKGLEYHTVIFIGLEDGAFWSFQQQPDEDKCAFFVALSRAKERVIFTFSSERLDKYGRNRSQTFDKIEVLFNELENSGIVDIMQRKP